MTVPKQNIWRLVQDCAEELTKSGTTPFKRSDLVRGVQRKNPVYEPNSINPIIQGVTDNLRGGAPGAVGKNILHSVGRGIFILNEGSVGHKKSHISVTDGRDTETGGGARRQIRKPENASAGADNVRTTRIGKYEFRYISAIDPEREADGAIREIISQASYDNSAQLPLNRYGKGAFCKFKIPRNIEIAGVYALCANGDVRYIGECVGLSSRYNMGYGNISPRNCFVGGQETNCRINSLVLQEIKGREDVSLWFYATEEYKTIERELRESLSLRWNRV